MIYKLWLYNMRTIEPLLPNSVNVVLFNAKIFWKWVFYFCNNRLNFYLCAYPFFITFNKIQTADCDLMTAIQPEILKLYRNLWQVSCPSVDKIFLLCPAGVENKGFIAKGSPVWWLASVIWSSFVLYHKVRKVYHLFMQLRLRILIWEREWCTRSSIRMSQDIGTVCWYTCSHRGGMSLRNQIHSMLQRWHVCNTFHCLPNTLKYAEKEEMTMLR